MPRRRKSTTKERANSFLDMLAQSVAVENPMAYVALKTCGCIAFAATSEWIERNVSAFSLSVSLHNETIRGVTQAEYNALKMKCDSCYRKGVA